MIRALDDANFVRICKLAAVAASIGICLAGASFLLRGNLRQIAAGAVAGLAVSTVTMLVETYRRCGPADTGPGAAIRKAQRGRAGVAIGLLLASVLTGVLRALHADWFVGGLVTGFFAFFGLMVSPLFWTPPSRRVAPSPRA